MAIYSVPTDMNPACPPIFKHLSANWHHSDVLYYNSHQLQPALQIIRDYGSCSLKHLEGIRLWKCAMQNSMPFIHFTCTPRIIKHPYNRIHHKMCLKYSKGLQLCLKEVCFGVPTTIHFWSMSSGKWGEKADLEFFFCLLSVISTTCLPQSAAEWDGFMICSR